MSDSSAFCVLVSGPPGGGKTTFARALAERIPVMLLSMDDVKSSIAMGMTPRSSSGAPAGADPSVAGLGGPAGQRAFSVTYAVAETYLRSGVSIVLEKAWQLGRAESDLLPLLGVGKMVQVHVSCEQAEAVARGLARPDRPGLVNMAAISHMLDAGQMQWASFGLLDLPIPSLVIKTDAAAAPVDWSAVERFVWESTA